ncbi:MAG: nucleotidyltransferase family protein [Candidatus Baltobacteraceae bacterium]
MRPFSALFEAMTALVRPDHERLKSALHSVPGAQLFGHSARHKCSAYLLEAFLTHRIGAPELRPLRVMLQRYAGTFALQAVEARAQTAQIVSVLRDARIPAVLLKSSARLYAGDPIAERSQIFDLDALVRPQDADAAVTALAAAGYAYEQPGVAAGYRMRHHHLAPLVSPAFSKALELHVALAPRGSFTLATGWDALAPYHRQIEGPAGPATRLDEYGSALHLALHGAGLYRLGDVVQIAMIVHGKTALLDRLAEASAREKVQRVPLQAALCAAAAMAGLPQRFGADVRRYVAWALEREGLPRPFRGRMHLTDAYYANGRRLRGPATALALPAAYANDGVRQTLARRARVLGGRMLAGAAFAARLPGTGSP